MARGVSCASRCCHRALMKRICCCQAARRRVGRPAAPEFALALALRHDGGVRVRCLAADRRSIRHGSSSMFARESDAVSPRLGRCTILVSAAGTSRVTRRASREPERPLDVVVIGAHLCAFASQWCVGQPRLVCLSVAWRHSSSSDGSRSSIGGNAFGTKQTLRDVHGGPRRSRSRLQRELARRRTRRCVSAVATATAAAAAAARAARTR